MPCSPKTCSVLLDVDHAAGVGERGVGVVAGQVADLLVSEEGGDDDDDLADGEPGPAVRRGVRGIDTYRS